MIVIAPLSLENVTTHFDEKRAIAHITYRGILRAGDSEAAYKWLGELIVCIGTERLYGEIFDFRDVRSFSTDNLIDARKKSRKMNIMMNTQDFPVAMVVANDMQEQILRGPMRIMEENPRKRIVHATEDALAFLDEWHNRSAHA
ncbi:MAG: hypothetical protein AAF653_21825 [Chloroflexota bacterium]